MAQYSISGDLLAEKNTWKLMKNGMGRTVKCSGCELGKGGNMELVKILENACNEGLLHDITPVSEAIFEKGIKCVVSSSLHETLDLVGRDYPVNMNSPFEEMLLDIKKAFKTQWFIEKIGHVTDIREFLALGQKACVAVEILELPDFLVFVVPLPELTTLLVMELEEAKEDFGIRI